MFGIREIDKLNVCLRNGEQYAKDLSFGGRKKRPSSLDINYLLACVLALQNLIITTLAVIATFNIDKEQSQKQRMSFE